MLILLLDNILQLINVPMGWVLQYNVIYRVGSALVQAQDLFVVVAHRIEDRVLVVVQ